MAYVHAHIESHHRTSFQASSLAVHGEAGALHLVFISHYTRFSTESRRPKPRLHQFCLTTCHFRNPIVVDNPLRTTNVQGVSFEDVWPELGVADDKTVVGHYR